VRAISCKGDDRGQLQAPTGVAISADDDELGTLFVSDALTGSISAFGLPDGAFRHRWVVGTDALPAGLCASGGLVLVCVTFAKLLCVFCASDGVLEKKLDCGNFYPTGVCVTLDPATAEKAVASPSSGM